MGIAKPPPVCSSSSRKKTHNISTLHRHHHHKNPARTHKPGSMSGQHQEYHHPQQENIFAFPPGLAHHDQIRRDTTKLRSGFDPSPPSSTLLAIDHAAPATVDPSTAGLHPVYETAGMLSEMFNNFGPGPGLGSDWYGGGNRQVGGRDNIGDHPHEQQQQQQQSSDHHVHQHHHHHHHHHQIPSINADSAAAMQLFLTNPPPRSPSPPQQPPSGSANSNSTLHMLLPSPSTISPGGGGFHSIGGLHHHHHPSPNPNFWSVAGTHIDNPSELSGVVEGQGLSLSLSSSLQHLDAAKEPQDTHHIMFFNQHNDLQQHQSMMQANLQGVAGPFGSGPGPSSTGQHQVHHLGFGSASTSSSLGVVNVLRNSKYAKPAQELLEEFCSVGKGHLKKSKLSRQNSVNPTGTTSGGPGGGGGGGGGSSSSTKDPPPLSAADRIEHQRRKVKLLSMLDEVDRRYNNYCEQMQMVVNSFDLVMGYGAATPYTALAQKAMSRHFRCLKDAIQSQLRQSCELLGEKDPTATSGLTKGETPRLKMLEQSLRQQRAFHQMGLMEQEAWRPQRGLPERSVNILRAWLFEHFLHPYPNDADKHLLARQTGLSRNQVSNWFINARVRLWKPMVEEMYQQEAKELEDEAETDINQTSSSTSNTNPNPNPNQNPNPNTNTNTNTFVSTHNPMPCSSSSAAFSDAKRSTETMTPPDSDPSSLPTINRGHHHHHQPPQPPPQVSALPGGGATTIDNVNVGPTTMIRFGTAAGDVSLTLGLRHAGNTPEKSAAFSVRDFGSC